MFVPAAVKLSINAYLNTVKANKYCCVLAEGFLWTKSLVRRHKLDLGKKLYVSGICMPLIFQGLTPMNYIRIACDEEVLD